MEFSRGGGFRLSVGGLAGVSLRRCLHGDIVGEKLEAQLAEAVSYRLAGKGCGGDKDHEEGGDGEVAAAQVERAGSRFSGVQLPQERVGLSAAPGAASGVRMSGEKSSFL